MVLLTTRRPAPILPVGRWRTGGQSEGRSSGRFVAHVAVFAVLALVPLLSYWEDFHSDVQRALMASFVMLCAIGTAAGTYLGLRPLILLWSVFLYCWLAVPASYQIAFGVAAWQDGTVTQQVGPTTSALSICVVAQFSVLVGYFLGGARKRNDLPAVALNPRQILMYRRASSVCLTLAAILLPVAAAIVGGVNALLSTREQLNNTIAAAGYSGDTGVFTLVKLFPGQLCIVAALTCLYVLRSAPHLSRPLRRRMRFKLFLALVLLFLYANPFAHTRYIFLAAFGSVAMMALRTRGWRTAISALAVALIAFLFAYPAANYFRAGQEHRVNLVQSFTTSDFDGFQQTINTVTLVQQLGHDDGVHVVSAALFFVPRSVWTGKATPASIEVASERGYSFTDLSLPLPAELYLDLGWLGLLLMSAALGLVWRRLDHSWRGGGKGAVIASYLAVAQIGLIRGPLGSLVPVYGIVVFILLGLLIRSNRLAPKP